MIIAKQLSVFLANKPGVLAKLCESLTEQNVNILALSISDTVDHAVVRIVTSDPDKTQSLFEAHNMLAVESDVLLLHLPNKPGELGKLAAKLAKIKVNIEYAYGTSPNGAAAGAFVIRVSDIAKAKKALK